jgi:hypothetical protein
MFTRQDSLRATIVRKHGAGYASGKLRQSITSEYMPMDNRHCKARLPYEPITEQLSKGCVEGSPNALSFSSFLLLSSFIVECSSVSLAHSLAIRLSLSGK